MTAHTDADTAAARPGAVLYPSDAGRLKLTGADARDLLNRLSTNYIDPVGTPGSVVPTVLTSDRGRIVDLVHLAHCGDHQLLLTSPGRQDGVIAFLDKYTIMEDLEVADLTPDTAMLTLTGPAAGAIGQQAAIPAGVTAIALPDDDGGDSDDDDAAGGRAPTRHFIAADDAAAAALAAALRRAGAVPIGAAAAETLRIIRRQPAYGAELGDAYNPLEAGLIGAIDFHKGCYIGQEVIARLDTYQKVQKRLVALRFDGVSGGICDGDGISAVTGARLVDDAGAPVGIVTSAAVANEPDAAGAPAIIGLGYVRTAAAQIGARLRLQLSSDVGAGDALPSDADAGAATAQITHRPLLFGGEKPARNA